MKRKHGGFLLGKSSGRNPGSNLPSYKSNSYHSIGSATVADSIGNTFQSRYIPQQAPLGTSQHSASPMYPPLDDQGYRGGLSQERKIDELKRLVHKYPQYQDNDPNVIVEWANYCSMNGDNKFLDDKLEQLRRIDGLANNQLRFL
jgi:hypothetical protein